MNKIPDWLRAGWPWFVFVTFFQTSFLCLYFLFDFLRVLYWSLVLSDLPK